MMIINNRLALHSLERFFNRVLNVNIGGAICWIQLNVSKAESNCWLKTLLTALFSKQS